jgi:hypothetical protein
LLFFGLMDISPSKESGGMPRPNHTLIGLQI